MPTNPKYKSLDDILSALKDEDQPDQTPTEEAEDLPKKFPKISASETIKVEKNVESDEPITEQRTMNTEHSKPSTKEISEIADELDKEEDQETKEETSNEQRATSGELEDDDPIDDVSEPETSNEKPETSGKKRETSDEKPKSTWRTSPANLKNDTEQRTMNSEQRTTSDEEGASLPESMRDERPNFDVPSPVSGATPKPAAQGRWADFPEYPTNTEDAAPSSFDQSDNLEEITPTHQPFESNLSDIVENDLGDDLTKPDGFPIRRIDHSANNRFGSVRGDRQAKLGNTYSGQRGVDDDSLETPKSRSFDYNLTNNSSKNRKWQYLIIALVALITVSAIVFLLKNQYIPFVGSSSQVVISSPSPPPAGGSSPSPSPSPTPIPDIDRSVFRLRVLNGTTTSGLASSVADKLKALGFKIDKIGNNSNQSVAQTTIRVKPNDASLSAQLVKDLTGQFEATIGSELKSTDSYDGEVVIGAK